MQEDLLKQMLIGDIDNKEIRATFVKDDSDLSKLKLQDLKNVLHSRDRARYALLSMYLNGSHFSIEMASALDSTIRYCNRNANAVAYMMPNETFRENDHALEMIHYVTCLENDEEVLKAIRLAMDETVLQDDNSYVVFKEMMKKEQKHQGSKVLVKKKGCQ